MIIYIREAAEAARGGASGKIRRMSEPQQVIVSVADGVYEVRLNRPDKRNAITLEMYRALTGAVHAANVDDSVRVILFSGAGASFTSGNDLNDFLSGPPIDEDHDAARFIRTLPAIRKVMVAAVQGATVGIGVTLLLHCDLVVAARGARLSMPFVKLGLVPEAASSLLLPRLVGYQRAAEMLLLGEPIDAERAFDIGMVNRIVDEAALMGEARALAHSLAQQPGGALLATRRLLQSGSTTLLSRMEEELEAFREQLGSAEFRAAAQAFLGKRRGS
jgi:enoyl-CoA hydratase/carnithine racemase